MHGMQETIVTNALPALPVEIDPEEERRVRAYIWAIVARLDRPKDELEAEAVRLWTEFGETYAALISGPYARTATEALRISLGRL